MRCFHISPKLERSLLISSSEVLAQICVKNYQKRREMIKILLRHHKVFPSFGSGPACGFGTAQCKKAQRNYNHFSAKPSAELKR